MLQIKSKLVLNKQEFEELYKSLQPKLIRYVTGLLNGDVELSADVVDEAFIAFWRNDTNAEIEMPFSWLRRVCRNKAIDAIRKNREVLGVGDSAENEALNLLDNSKNPAEQYEASQQREMIKRGMKNLSPDHSEVIWLCYFEDRSISEISAIVEAPENTIKSRLHYARKLLVGEIQESGLTN